MHELSIAQGLMLEADRVARRHGAACIDRLVVRVGALSGVEPPLLGRAFTVARSGTRAANATLEIEIGEIEIRCPSCGVTTATSPNHLVCASCGEWKVDVVSGTELLLVRLELSGLSEESPDPATSYDRHPVDAH